jgi:MFS family permease
MWFASLSSSSSAWALIVARAALVLDLTGSAAWTGYVTFAAMIPGLLVSPLAGYLADRYDRRTVMAWAYAVNLVQILLLAFLVADGSIQPWHILVLAVVNGTARSIQTPSSQALLVNLVPREQITNAVSLFQVTFQGSRLTGPVLILGVLWFTDNPEWPFYLCAALYVVGLGLALSVRRASRGVVEAGRGMRVIMRNMVAGLSFMYHHPLVLSLVLLVVAHCGMTMSFESLLPVLSQERLGVEKGADVLGRFSLLMVGYGGGAIVAALYLAGAKAGGNRGRLLLWLGILSGVTPAALGLSPNLMVAVLATAGMGLSQGGFMTVSAAMMQNIAPDEIRGRMMGVYNMHILGLMASFNMINGTLVDFTALNASIVLAAGGIGFVAVAILGMSRVTLRQLYSQGVPVT